MNNNNKRVRTPSRKLTEANEVKANEDNVDDDDDDDDEEVKEVKKKRKSNQRTNLRAMLSPEQVHLNTSLNTSARRGKRYVSQHYLYQFDI